MIIKVLTRFGFEKISQKGSHAKFKNSVTPIKTVIIPMHSEVRKGTLKSILQQADITIDEFVKHL
ncbi:MAG: hypothetical protein COA82_13310 [Alkaliphilus sp.]|nr:type II toxin-antitoxin system HicA family toxin [bacterium AH-315-L21]MBN4062855.1 type II toxin-antitoxin system HicA family toxin [Alkaliphilus sp. AH-315-G20]MBN4067854.1 type II toxin-antitoxin system HicA family toxin [Alkaliphilus transvaalensis]PHS28836.1 MAG: hypothetical protein COA82_13310 [Alkaliphilus sp.]